VALDGRHIEDSEGETSFDRYLLGLNRDATRVRFKMPASPRPWFTVLSSDEAEGTPHLNRKGSVTLPGRSLLLLHRPI
jgi:hypothetical protein